MQFQLFCILNIFFFFFFLEPNQAKRAVQQSQRFSRLDSDAAAEWTYLQSLNLDCWHTDAPICTRCQTRAPQPCLPSPLVPACTGQWNRSQEGPWLLFLFSAALGTPGSWPDSPGFLTSAQPLTSSRARGSPGRSEETV